jgi:hypothetical protein
MTHDTSLPHYPVRAGVYFPDWTAVTSADVREALSAILGALGVEAMWRNYRPAEDRVRTTLLRLYAEAGRAPGSGELARRAGFTWHGACEHPG